MSWLYLAGAIAFEVVGTTALKLSHGMSRLLPTVVMAVCYVVCFTLLSQALKRIDVGVAYAIWSGVGTALLATVGVLWFKEPLTAIRIASILLIILGVAGLNLSGAAH